jgi:transmembrane sensor
MNAAASRDATDALAARWIARRDAGLSETEAAEFARWRDADPRHAAALARFETAWSALARPRETGGTAGLARELAAVRARSRRRRALAGGATVAAALFASVWWPRPAPLPAPVAPVASAVLLVPEIRTLADGSVVELKPGAAIEVAFSDTVRRVRLVRGEALFAVAKQPARPFVVAAGGVEIRAVGTAFSVELAAAAVGVLVTEGRVAVQPAGGAPAPALVDAGNRARVATGPGGGAIAVAAVSSGDVDAHLAWRAPQVEFSGTPLAAVVDTINRHAREPGRPHPHFAVEDPALARVTLSGLFRLDDTAAFVRMLEAGFGVTVVPREDGVLVLHPRH